MSSAPEPRRSPWPFAIVVGLLLVIVVNALFAYVAISGADDVVPSYTTEPR